MHLHICAIAAFADGVPTLLWQAGQSIVASAGKDVSCPKDAAVAGIPAGKSMGFFTHVQVH